MHIVQNSHYKYNDWHIVIVSYHMPRNMKLLIKKNGDVSSGFEKCFFTPFTLSEEYISNIFARS